MEKLAKPFIKLIEAEKRNWNGVRVFIALLAAR